VFQGVREEMETLARPATGAGGSSKACLGSPTTCLSSMEPRREVGDRSDGRDPPVSGCVRERVACARRGRRVGQPGPGINGPAALPQCVFPFLFILKVNYV